MVEVLGALLFVGFFLAGAAKLVGVDEMELQFAEFGLSTENMRLTGILEILGAFGLFVGPYPEVAAVGLAVLMLAAMYYHRVANHPLSKSIPAFLLMVGSFLWLGIQM